MSSTGTISPVKSFPSTSMGEQQRQQNITNQNETEQLKQKIGKIYKIHDTKPLVKVYNPINGNTICNNRWVLLNHSPQEIVEKWGQIKVGMGVSVMIMDKAENNATATIIHSDGTDYMRDDIEENTIELGVYAFMTPGI